MRRRSLIIFVIINVFVSLGVVLIVLSTLDRSNQGGSQPPMLVTVPLIITATPDPNAGPTLIIITATPRPGEVILPTDLQTEIALAETNAPIPTIDATILAQDSSLQSTTTALPTNCIPYVLQEGDTPFAIAVEYGVDFEEFMAVNGLTDETASFLQIGQVLVVPLSGCELTAAALSASETATFQPTETDTPTESPFSATPEPSETSEPSTTPTNTRTPTQTPTPTATVPPTAENPQVEVVRVVGVGQINAEGVEIRNSSAGIVDFTGWTMLDEDGSVYEFPAERRLFGNGGFTVFSRVGQQDTAAALYWNRDEAVWESGESVTLLDNRGRAQSVFEIP